MRYGGHVAQFLGDGVLVYFGYPQAHEDAADRAARAALAAVKVVAALEPAPETRLATRIGIATGQVVVGEIGAGTTAADQSASGETPNLAARLQAQAQPGEIVLSSQTIRLLGGAFESELLGLVHPKGLPAPVQAWRLIGERGAATRFDAKHVTALSPFVGRERELELLRERLQLARKGQGRIVLLTGEAGIGKSRVCLSLRDKAAASGCETVVWQCSPYFGGSALYPVMQQLMRSAAIDADDTPQAAAAKLDAAHVRMGAGLLAGTNAALVRAIGLQDGSGVGQVSSGQSLRQTKRQSLESVLEMLRGLAAARTVLLLIEDAHWADPTTEELIGLLADRIGSARIMMVVTARPEYCPSWGLVPHMTGLTLSRLGHRQCSALIDSLAGKSLPDEVRAEMVSKADGIPLFVEELTRTVMESGLLHETKDRFILKGPLCPLAIPSTLQDSLMARLDRLSPTKEVAQAGAVIGREFSYRVLAAVLQLPQERLQHALDELVATELVSRRGLDCDATYTFKHALVRDTAYNSMLRNQRVMRHAQVAAAIEQLAPETVTAQPELLALHYREGAQPAQAFRYFAIAGRSAMSKSECPEAVSHLKAALALMPQLPPDCLSLPIEFELQLELGGALMQTVGYGAETTQAAYQRGREIALMLSNPDMRVRASRALGMALIGSGRCRAVIQMFDELEVADSTETKGAKTPSRQWIVGAAHYMLGNLREADSTLSAAMQALGRENASSRERIGDTDSFAAILLWHGQVHVHLGLLDRAEAVTAEALALGEQLNHGETRVWSLYRAAWLSLLKGNTGAALSNAQKAVSVAERLGLMPWIGRGQMVLGQAQLACGAVEVGLGTAKRGFDLWTDGGTTTNATEFASVTGHSLFAAGRLREAAEYAALGEGIQRVTDERHFEAELIRLRGRFYEQDGDLDTAEEHYRRAVDIASRRGALLFQLRAAIELHRMAHQRGDGDGAQLLRSTYERFSEGFDFPDLVHARAILGS
jgi:tetratricopeptide (TPR) repeat protein